MGLFSRKRSSRKSDSSSGYQKQDSYGPGYGTQPWQPAPPAYAYPQDVTYYPTNYAQRPNANSMPQFSNPGTGTAYYTSNHQQRSGGKMVSFAPSNGYR